MPTTAKKLSSFKKEIWDFYKKEGRDLPWRRTKDPYKIVISEVMLQQTQVNRVITKYKEFITEFPNFKALVKAPTSKVLKVWSGLGYNRRALYLRALSRIIIRDHKGRLPDSLKTLIQFPAIGSATAGSILAFAYNMPTVFIETNVRRVFIYHFFKGREEVHDREILSLVKATVDKKNPREWYFALMDYGTMLSRKYPNPNRKSRHYTRQSAFVGSDRKIRGEIVRLLLAKKQMSIKALHDSLKITPSRLSIIVEKMVREGFLRKRRDGYGLQ